MKLLENLLDRLSRVNYVADLYDLENDFNNVGLSLQQSGKRLILCRVIDGRPIIDENGEFYLSIGHVDHAYTTTTNRRVLFEFITTNAGKPTAVGVGPKSYEHRPGFLNNTFISERHPFKDA